MLIAALIPAATCLADEFEFRFPVGAILERPTSATPMWTPWGALVATSNDEWGRGEPRPHFLRCDNRTPSDRCRWVSVEHELTEEELWEFAEGILGRDLERLYDGEAFPIECTDEEKRQLVPLFSNLTLYSSLHFRTELLLVPGGPVAADADFDSLLMRPGTVLLESMAKNGVLTAAGDLERVLCHDDYEINQTGVLPVCNPVIRQLHAGHRAELRVSWGGTPDHVEVDLIVGKRAVQVHEWELGEDWSALNLPRVQEQYLKTTVLAPLNKSIVCGTIAGPLPRHVVLRVRPLESVPLSPSFWEWAEERRRIVAGGIDQRRTVVPVRSNHESIFAFSREPEPEEVFRSEPPRKVETTLEVVRCTAASYVALRKEIDAQGVLAEEWREKLGADSSIDRFVVPGITQKIACTRFADTRAYLQDVELMSGGCMVTQTEPDPVIGTCGAGIEFRVFVEVDPRSGRPYLETAGGQVELHELKERSVKYPMYIHSSKGQVRVRRSMVLGEPRQRVRDWSFAREIPAGTDVVLSQKLDDKGEAWVVVGRVELGAEQ